MLLFFFACMLVIACIMAIVSSKCLFFFRDFSEYENHQ